MKSTIRIATALAFALCILTQSGCSMMQPNATDQKQAQQSNPAHPPGTDVAELPDAKSPEILPDTHMSAARLHESQGHLARAIDQYRQVVALAPTNIEAYNRLGMCLDRLGRFKEAEDAFTKGLQRAPDHAYLHNNLAFSYIMQSRWADAEAELGQALEQRPDFPRARVNLAMVYAQQERFTESLTQFQLAVPKDDAWYNIGLMYQSKNRPKDAAKAFKTALEHNPKMVAARKRLDLLPPEIVNAVKETFDVTASPAPKAVATAPAAEKVTHPTTQPTATPSRRAETKEETKALKEPQSTRVTVPTPEPVAKATPVPEAATHVSKASEFGPAAESPPAPVVDEPCQQAQEAPVPQIVLAQLPEFQSSLFESTSLLTDSPDCTEADDSEQPDPENTWWHNAEALVAP